MNFEQQQEDNEIDDERNFGINTGLYDGEFNDSSSEFVLKQPVSKEYSINSDPLQWLIVLVGCYIAF